MTVVILMALGVGVFLQRNAQQTNRRLALQSALQNTLANNRAGSQGLAKRAPEPESGTLAHAGSVGHP